MNHGFSDLLTFVGRWHVMLVHLPIGFLILLAVLEGLSVFPRFKHIVAGNRVILVCSVVVTAVTAGCGWLLSLSDEYNAHLLFWHKWLGTALVPIVALLLGLHWWNRTRAYRACLVVTMILLMVTGHFGGSLTHGSDYLFPWTTVRTVTKETYAELMSKPVYAGFVQPILDQNCETCHGPDKAKADLRLDSAENIFKGGEDGPVVVAGSAAQSDLIRRIELPGDSDDHMPPPGKRQPSFDDIALLQWWVNSGAPTNKTAVEMNPPENIVRILQAKGTAVRN